MCALRHACQLHLRSISHMHTTAPARKAERDPATLNPGTLFMVRSNTSIYIYNRFIDSNKHELKLTAVAAVIARRNRREKWSDACT